MYDTSVDLDRKQEMCKKVTFGLDEKNSKQKDQVIF